MIARGKLVFTLVTLALLLSLGACGKTAAPSTTPMPTTMAVPSTASATATGAPATSTPVPQTATPGPITGGKLVIGSTGEPNTLDPALTNMAAMTAVMSLVNDALITQDPATGRFIPSLAESWSFSADGLTGTFKLRTDAKWHDGSTLTARDFEYAFNRALDPTTKSTGTGRVLSTVNNVVALDDYTLQLGLKAPWFPILMNLASAAYASPLPKSWMESSGPEKYGRSPVGCGPYKFVEWQTGVKIVLQRNPDYTWGPAWVKGPFIDTIEFRYIPEISTIMAGLEAGELDYAGIPMTDLNRIKNSGTVQIFGTVSGGNPAYVTFNQSLPLFKDLSVRKALAMAVDRKPIIQAVFGGDAVEMYGPLTPTTAGYDPVQETYGYRLDVAGAKAVLQSAGYTYGADGLAMKDGKNLKFALNSISGLTTSVNLAQILKEQWKAIGVTVDIQQLDLATVIGNLVQGKYESTIMSYSNPDFEVIPLLYGGTGVGGGNQAQVSDPEWDKLLLATRTNLDQAKRQEACNAAAKYMMQNVLLISTASPKSYIGVSNRVKGFGISEVTGASYLLNAYIPK